jgi:hypothetical protein
VTETTDLLETRTGYDTVAELLGTAGFAVRVRALREPEPPMEKTRQAYLLATGPA